MTFTAKAGTGQKLGKRFAVVPIETKVSVTLRIVKMYEYLKSLLSLLS